MAKPKPGGYNYQDLTVRSLDKTKAARERIDALMQKVRQQSDRQHRMPQWGDEDFLELYLAAADLTKSIEYLSEQLEIIKDDRRAGTIVDFPERRVSNE